MDGSSPAEVVITVKGGGRGFRIAGSEVRNRGVVPRGREDDPERTRFSVVRSEAPDSVVIIQVRYRGVAGEKGAREICEGAGVVDDLRWKRERRPRKVAARMYDGGPGR